MLFLVLHPRARTIYKSNKDIPNRLLSYQDDVAYEEREYDGGKFATVELTGKPFDEALHEAALKLLKYVGGSNDQGEKLYGPSGFSL